MTVEHVRISHSLLSTDSIIDIVRDNYDIVPLSCKSINFGINDIYEVSSPTSKYVMRVSPSHRYLPYTKTGYEEEVRILLHLLTDEMLTAQPLKLEKGTYLGEIEVPEGKRYFILFEYIDGIQVKINTSQIANDMGILLGNLHTSLDEFIVTEPRFEMDLKGLFETPLQTFVEHYPDHPELDNLKIIKEDIISKLEPVIGDMSFGYIHGDFQGKNIHIHHERYTVFDFDMSCPGYRMYDIAVLTSAAKFFGIDLNAEMINAFLDGYRSKRELTDREMGTLPLFEIGRAYLALGEYSIQRKRFGDLPIERNIERTIMVIKQWYSDLG